MLLQPQLTSATLQLPLSLLLLSLSHLVCSTNATPTAAERSELFSAAELPPFLEEQQQSFDDDYAELPADVATDATTGEQQQKVKQAVIAAFPALFMQLHNEQQQQQHKQQHLHKMPTVQKQLQQHLYQQKHQQQQQHRHCSIAITQKIVGVCQPLKHIGSACVSGEYMDAFNAECM